MPTELTVEQGDDRDILEVLKAELNFLEKGGYGRSVRAPWLPPSAFQDSPTCPYFPYHDHIDTCELMRFVPPDRRDEETPCHHIALNDAGMTVAQLEKAGGQPEIERLLKIWLGETIARIEKERSQEPALV